MLKGGAHGYSSHTPAKGAAQAAPGSVLLPGSGTRHPAPGSSGSVASSASWCRASARAWPCIASRPALPSPPWPMRCRPRRCCLSASLSCWAFSPSCCSLFPVASPSSCPLPPAPPPHLPRPPLPRSPPPLLPTPSSVL